MNSYKSLSALFCVPITDIEDIANTTHASHASHATHTIDHHHIHKEYKDNCVFNELLECLAEEFKNNMDTFKTINDIDRFKKGIQKKYR